MLDHPSTDPGAANAGFDAHAVAIAKRQYFQPGEESVADMFRRVAGWVAMPERSSTRDEYAERYFQLMMEKRFCPGGRVLAGAATHHGNVLNCFVQDGSPEEVGTDSWVLHLATKLALVTKVGGGNGVNLDPLGPKRRFDGATGRLHLTIDRAHADYEKVATGTFLDLVRGEMVTRGYRAGRFVERDDLPAGVAVRLVGDSVEDIWHAAADAVRALLAGHDIVVDLSDLRAEGTPVAGSGGTSSGPSSFAVEVYDNFAIWAGLGGARFAGPVATLRYVFAPTLRAIRQGGCLHPDTLVHTSKGTLRLAELVDGHQLGWQDHHLKVATDEGWKTSPRGFNNGASDTLRVQLANGQSLRGTPNHKLKVRRADGRRDWVPFEELVAGDEVVRVLDQHTGAPAQLRPLDTPDEPATAPFRAPEILTDRLALLLGYLFENGTLSADGLEVAFAEGSALAVELPELLAELFGVTDTSVGRGVDGRQVLRVGSTQLTAWLRSNGLLAAAPGERAVPKAVRMSPRPVLASFLRGLHEAAGRTENAVPVLELASGRAADDVVTLLAGLGVPCGLSATRAAGASAGNASYLVIPEGEVGLERWQERVGRAAASLPARPHMASAPSGRAGSAPLTLVAHPLRSTYTASVASPARVLVRGAPANSSSAVVAEESAALEEQYVAVVAVEPAGRTLTLDLSVDENRTYLAGGFVTHNTRRGAGMATLAITHPDVDDFITAKDLERERAEGDISTFNISVLVSDEFMEHANGEQGKGKLWEIAQHAWATGEPGLIYVDRINEHNPMRSALGDIRSTNPCVTSDTWVHTQRGARQVHQLVGEEFCANVDGAVYPTVSEGFFPTGVKPVFKLTTRRGFTLRLTANHQLRKVTERGALELSQEWVELAQLQPGDEIMLSDHRSVAPWSGPGSEDEGWLLGMLVGTGNFATDKPHLAYLDFRCEERRRLAELAETKLRGLRSAIPGSTRTEREEGIRLASRAVAELAERFGIGRGRKAVTDEVEGASHAFTVGFVRGLFDAHGSVEEDQAQGASVRLAHADPAAMQRVQRMLARLGILTSIYEERRPHGVSLLPDGEGGMAQNPVRAPHELVIANDDLFRFRERIGFGSEAKRRHLEETLARYTRTPGRERFADAILSIEPDGEEEVFDVTVAHVHAFDANGIVAHNCGEIPLYAGEPCDLGALNLAAYVVRRDAGLAGYDFDGFAADVATCVRFLDNVLDVNRFALEDNREMSMKLRRLGLGVMGLADALILMGYGYDTEAGRDAVSAIIGSLRKAATEASVKLAAERGAFPLYDVSDLTTARRNVAILTVAPTGTTSMLMGVSSGVEPVFAPFIYRKIGTDYHALIHPLFQELLEEHAPHPDYRAGDGWDWEKVVAAVQDNHGSVQGLAFIPEEVRRVMVCAHDISPASHVRMQGVVQRAFDDGDRVANSISKTINLPNQATTNDVYEAYRLAFTTGCKGITVYRDGSRDFQVLSTSTSSKKDEAASEGVASEPTTVSTQAIPAGQASPHAMAASAAPTTAAADGLAAATATQAQAATTAPGSRAAAQAPRATRADYLPGEPLFTRPARLTGFTDTVKLMLPSGDKRGFFVTVNMQDGLPAEVFIVSGKAGDEANADSEALGRVVSIALQYGVPAEALVKTLRGINGGMFGTYQGRMVASKADLIAVALETVGVENVLNRGKGCPDCGAPLRFEEGCAKCEACGYSKCG